MESARCRASPLGPVPGSQRLGLKADHRHPRALRVSHAPSVASKSHQGNGPNPPDPSDQSLPGQATAAGGLPPIPPVPRVGTCVQVPHQTFLDMGPTSSRFWTLVTHTLVQEPERRDMAILLACLESVYRAEYQQLAGEVITAIAAANNAHVRHDGSVAEPQFESDGGMGGIPDPRDVGRQPQPQPQQQRRRRLQGKDDGEGPLPMRTCTAAALSRPYGTVAPAVVGSTDVTGDAAEGGGVRSRDGVMDGDEEAQGDEGNGVVLAADLDAAALRQLLRLAQRAGYQPLTVRDVRLADSLNADYLSQLFIKGSTHRLDGALVQDHVDPSLPAEALPVLLLQRGYGRELQAGRLLLQKLDYLQTLAVGQAGSWAGAAATVFGAVLFGTFEEGGAEGKTQFFADALTGVEADSGAQATAMVAAAAGDVVPGEISADGGGGGGGGSGGGGSERGESGGGEGRRRRAPTGAAAAAEDCQVTQDAEYGDGDEEQSEDVGQVLFAGENGVEEACGGERVPDGVAAAAARNGKAATARVAAAAAAAMAAAGAAARVETAAGPVPRAQRRAAPVKLPPDEDGPRACCTAHGSLDSREEQQQQRWQQSPPEVQQRRPWLLDLGEEQQQGQGQAPPEHEPGEAESRRRSPLFPSGRRMERKQSSAVPISPDPSAAADGRPVVVAVSTAGAGGSPEAPAGRSAWEAGRSSPGSRQPALCANRADRTNRTNRGGPGAVAVAGLAKVATAAAVVTGVTDAAAAGAASAAAAAAAAVRPMATVTESAAAAAEVESAKSVGTGSVAAAEVARCTAAAMAAGMATEGVGTGSTIANGTTAEAELSGRRLSPSGDANIEAAERGGGLLFPGASLGPFGDGSGGDSATWAHGNNSAGSSCSSSSSRDSAGRGGMGTIVTSEGYTECSASEFKWGETRGGKEETGDEGVLSPSTLSPPPPPPPPPLQPCLEAAMERESQGIPTAPGPWASALSGVYAALSDWGLVPRTDVIPLASFNAHFPVRERASRKPLYICKVSLADALGGADWLRGGVRGLVDGLLREVQLQEPTFREVLVLYRPAHSRMLSAREQQPSPPQLAASITTAAGARRWQRGGGGAAGQRRCRQPPPPLATPAVEVAEALQYDSDDGYDGDGAVDDGWRGGLWTVGGIPVRGGAGSGGGGGGGGGSGRGTRRRQRVKRGLGSGWLRRLWAGWRGGEEEPPVRRPPIQIRIYRDIPLPTWKVVLPEKLLQFRPLDLLRVDLFALAGLAGLLAQARYDNMLLDVITFGSAAILLVRIILGYQRMSDRFRSVVNELLVEKALAGQEGAVEALAMAAAQQQLRQAALAYVLLLHHRRPTGEQQQQQQQQQQWATSSAGGEGDGAAPWPLAEQVPAMSTTSQLQDLAEWALAHHSGVQVRFNACQALHELHRLGLVVRVTQHEDGGRTAGRGTGSCGGGEGVSESKDMSANGGAGGGWRAGVGGDISSSSSSNGMAGSSSGGSSCAATLAAWRGEVEKHGGCGSREAGCACADAEVDEGYMGAVARKGEDEVAAPAAALQGAWVPKPFGIHSGSSSSSSYEFGASGCGFPCAEAGCGGASGDPDDCCCADVWWAAVPLRDAVPVVEVHWAGLLWRRVGTILRRCDGL